ncbi:MAG: DUF192 domain-containing protein [Aliidiomarina sp.]|uniref:DUF192 domain-containing protein n=1 Tax=Aliidiomarina sp. TaxID=1872439 RepID=UPI0025BDB6FA|nr:DUF192 domain-containing protein [Aliidiomarina sp.]MCH8502074.1 DUF192 domain-containing protein [Aliidiomarina sp.]
MTRLDNYDHIRLREYGGYANFAIRLDAQWHFVGYLQVANSFLSRLLGWRRLVRQQTAAIPQHRSVGLWIPRCRAVQSFFMRQSLQLVWLDNQQQVLKVEDLQPNRVCYCWRADSVIELPSQALTTLSARHAAIQMLESMPGAKPCAKQVGAQS